ncbi:hypothetical protein HDV00_008712 [Rhizophlyctis rosea]|nr:hypothetical protein HDV00_008712 [Rhizophlyctis rosea]
MKVTFNTGRRLTGSSFDMEGEAAEYIDFSTDPQVRQNVDTEFNNIWQSLTQGLDDPLKRLRSTTKQRAGRAVAGHARVLSNGGEGSDGESLVNGAG